VLGEQVLVALGGRHAAGKVSGRPARRGGLGRAATCVLRPRPG
jgi:hypothetical protein